MISRVTGLHRNEGPAAGRSRFTRSREHRLDGRAIRCGLDHSRDQLDRPISRSRTHHLDRIVGGDTAGSLLEPRLFLQVPRGGPVTVAIQEGANDSAIQDTRECLMMRGWGPRGYDLITAHKASDMKPLRVCWATTEADALRGKAFLEGKFRHGAEVDYSE